MEGESTRSIDASMLGNRYGSAWGVGFLLIAIHCGDITNGDDAAVLMPHNGVLNSGDIRITCHQ